MAASLTVGELAALLKTRRDEAAAAASTATARILLDVFAVAERDGFDVRFRCGHQDSLGRLRRGRAQRLCSSVPLGVSVLDSGRRRPEQVRRSDERRAPPLPPSGLPPCGKRFGPWDVVATPARQTLRAPTSTRGSTRRCESDSRLWFYVFSTDWLAGVYPDWLADIGRGTSRERVVRLQRQRSRKAASVERRLKS